jgi:hypothetical protein
MKIERPNSLEITPEEREELEYLRVTIERAIEDGVITRIAEVLNVEKSYTKVAIIDRNTK